MDFLPAGTHHSLTGILDVFEARVRARTYSNHRSQIAFQPTVILPWGFQFFKTAYPVFEEGYLRFRNGVFRTPSFYGWWVIVSGPELTEALRSLPEDTASLIDLVNETLEVVHTMGQDIATNPYHVTIIKEKLTRSLPGLYHEIQEEVHKALLEHLPADDWTAVNGSQLVMKLVARATNRLFVGLPACREPEYLDTVMSYTQDVVMAGFILQMFPELLKTHVRRVLFPGLNRRVRKVAASIRPMVEECKAALAEFGKNYEGKRNDMLSWLIDEAQGSEQDLDSLARRVLILNFAGLHTTSMTFTHALYDLITHPSAIEPLRNEIEAVTGKDGYTKISMTKLVKMDSLFKESMRVNSISCIAMNRRAMRTFNLPDGTVIPKGTIICGNSLVHRDVEAFGPTADQFEPFRFEKGEGNSTSYAVTTSNKSLQFGHGVHACPGRFFAVNDMKIILCELIMDYDFKFAGGSLERPKDSRFGTTSVPNGEAQILFKKRATLL